VQIQHGLSDCSVQLMIIVQKHSLDRWVSWRR
jgi:hypothetical protein